MSDLSQSECQISKFIYSGRERFRGISADFSWKPITMERGSDRALKGARAAYSCAKSGYLEKVRLVAQPVAPSD